MYDTKPRKVDANTAQIVCNLAELAVRELESNWAVQVSFSPGTVQAILEMVPLCMPGHTKRAGASEEPRPCRMLAEESALLTALTVRAV